MKAVARALEVETSKRAISMVRGHKEHGNSRQIFPHVRWTRRLC
jgi:hypothetical protein